MREQLAVFEIDEWFAHDLPIGLIGVAEAMTMLEPRNLAQVGAYADRAEQGEGCGECARVVGDGRGPEEERRLPWRATAPAAHGVFFAHVGAIELAHAVFGEPGEQTDGVRARFEPE